MAAPETPVDNDSLLPLALRLLSPEPVHVGKQLVGLLQLALLLSSGQEVKDDKKSIAFLAFCNWVWERDMPWYGHRYGTPWPTVPTRVGLCASRDSNVIVLGCGKEKYYVDRRAYLKIDFEIDLSIY